MAFKRSRVRLPSAPLLPFRIAIQAVAVGRDAITMVQGVHVRLFLDQGAAGQLTTTSGPDCSNGAVSGFGTGSPASTMFSGLASTFVQAADGAPGLLASMASSQSTIVGTPPVVSLYTLSEPYIVCRLPEPM